MANRRHRPDIPIIGENDKNKKLLKVIPATYKTNGRIEMHPLDLPGRYTLDVFDVPRPTARRPIALEVEDNSIGIHSLNFQRITNRLKVSINVLPNYKKLYDTYKGDILIVVTFDNGGVTRPDIKFVDYTMTSFDLPIGTKTFGMAFVFTPFVPVIKPVPQPQPQPQPPQPRRDETIKLTPVFNRRVQALGSDKEAKLIFEIPLPPEPIIKKVVVPPNPIGISAVEFSKYQTGITWFGTREMTRAKFVLGGTTKEIFTTYQGTITMTTIRSDGQLKNTAINNTFDGGIIIGEYDKNITSINVELKFDPIYVPTPDELKLVRVIGDRKRVNEFRHALKVDTDIGKKDKYYFGFKARLLPQNTTVKNNFTIYDGIMKQLNMKLTDENTIKIIDISEKLRILCRIDYDILSSIRTALGNWRFTYENLIEENIIDIIYDTFTGEETINFDVIPTEPHLDEILILLAKNFYDEFRHAYVTDPAGTRHYLHTNAVLKSLIKILSPKSLIELFTTLASGKEFYIDNLEIEFLTNYSWMSVPGIFEKIYGEFYWERDPKEIDMLEEIYLKITAGQHEPRKTSEKIYNEYGIYLGDNPNNKFITDIDDYLVLFPDDPKTVEEHTEKQLFTKLKMILPHRSRKELNESIRQFQKGEGDFFFIPLSVNYAGETKRYEGDEDREELITTYEGLDEAIEGRTAVALGNLKTCYITDPGELGMILLKSKAEKDIIDMNFRDPRFGTDAHPVYFDEKKFLDTFYSAYGVCKIFEISYLIPEYNEQLMQTLNKEYDNLHNSIKEILDFRKTILIDGEQFHRLIRATPKEELDKLAHYLYILLYTAMVIRGWKEHGHKLPMRQGEWGPLGDLISDRINAILIEAAEVEETMTQNTKTILNSLKAREYGYDGKLGVDNKTITSIVKGIRKGDYCTRIASTKLVATASYFFDTFYKKPIQLLDDQLYLGLDFKPLFKEEEIDEAKLEKFSADEFHRWAVANIGAYYEKLNR